jgi:hypothetical protein
LDTCSHIFINYEYVHAKNLPARNEDAYMQ